MKEKEDWAKCWPAFFFRLCLLCQQEKKKKKRRCSKKMKTKESYTRSMRVECKLGNNHQDKIIKNEPQTLKGTHTNGNILTNYVTTVTRVNISSDFENATQSTMNYCLLTKNFIIYNFMLSEYKRVIDAIE